MDLSHLLSFMTTPLCYPTKIVFEWVHSLAMIKRGARFFLSLCFEGHFSAICGIIIFAVGRHGKFVFLFQHIWMPWKSISFFPLLNLAKKFNVNPVVELFNGAKWSHSREIRAGISIETLAFSTNKQNAKGSRNLCCQRWNNVVLTACIKNQGCAFSNGKSFISIVGGVSSFQFMRLASALCGMKPLTVTFTDTKFAY